MSNLFVFIFGLLIIAATVFLIYNLKRSSSPQSLLLLQQQISQISSQMHSQLNAIVSQVNQRLHENSQILLESNKNIDKRLDNAAHVINQVNSSLGKLYESNQHIYAIGKDISKLGDLLRAPSFRGGMGELMLENLLKEILPQQNFTLKHKFKDGQQVDAVIHLGGKLVPVDAKFPYDNFKKIVESTTESEKTRYRREFFKDVKNHISKIATSYILPQESTFDFALMYIPAENVYYETIIKEEICQAEDKTLYHYALVQKVIPVSPNSFYAYLQSIVLGLRGLQIEKNAQEIIAYLNHLRLDFQKFKEDFRVLGSHITNARNKFEEAESRLTRFDDRLETAAEKKQLTDTDSVLPQNTPAD